MDKNLTEIANKFAIDGEILNVTPYGEGHINATYLVETSGKRYILQRINDYVFPDVNGLMNNICGVTRYLMDKGVETLSVVYTKTGAPFYKDEKYYRVYDFIENTVTLQSVTDKKIFKNIGYAFGAFQNQLAGYDAKSLVEVIPHFHDTPKRYDNFIAALNEDVEERARTCAEEIQFMLDRKDTLSKITSGLQDGSLPLRVTHNDTKINNILVDAESGKARSVIDLDTVMAGSMLYDFGDSIRTGAATAKEDESDLSKVGIDLGLFKAYAEGFCSAVKTSITAKEKELIPYSVYLMTFEVGIRFLTDYLAGDVYFHTAYSNHNLVRARNQIKMVKEIEKNMDKMAEIIKAL